MSDLIDRQAAIDIERNATVDTNPSHFEAHQKFMQFMDDAEISSFGNWQWSNGFNTALTAVGIDLKKLPSAQPERKKGKWIKEGGFRHYIHYCSECGWALMDGPRGEPPYIGMEFNRANYERRYVLAGWTEEVMNFCPNCGADMRGETDETD